MSFYQKIKKFKIEISSASFIFMIALYFGFVFNFPVTSKLVELASETSDSIFAYFSPLLLSAAFIIIFSLFNIPYLRKPIFVTLVLSSSMASYATYKYGVMFDYGMIENIFETNTSEAYSYLNSNSLLYVLLFGLIPTILITKIHFRKKHPLSIRIMQKVVLVSLALATIAVIYALSYKNYVSVGRNNSYLNEMITPSHIYNTAKYIKNTYFKEPLEYQKIGEDAQVLEGTNGKPLLTVLVVGETARSMNIGYNGYNKNTNPYTEGSDIISFQDVSSCGTATAHSVPCMFSNMSRDNYNKEIANSQDNALDIIQRAGTSVLWIENDGGDKAVAKNVNKIQVDPNDYPTYCTGGVCVDEVMLEVFNNNVDLNGIQNQLITFHIIGSHGPTYWKRYPKEHELFTPSCNRSDIENCSNEEIVNVYDNTIAYTDYVLAKTIEMLNKYKEEYNVALMYISDHGESLGENGLYLHGTPYLFAPEQQTQVPWFLWIDKAFEKAYSIDRQCLKNNAQTKSYSQDNLFHTLLDFAGVETSALDTSKSLISQCRE